MNHDETTKLWQDLEGSVKDIVALFNATPHHRELPCANFYSFPGGCNVHRTRQLIDQHKGKLQPSKRSIVLRHDDESFRGVMISGEVPTAWYRYDVDDNGKLIFRSDADGTEFAPEKLAQYILMPFLHDLD